MSLSDKRKAVCKFNDGIESIDKYLYYEDDIKDFIKSLRQSLWLVNTVDDEFIEDMNKRMERKLDELAGNELTFAKCVEEEQ